MKYFKDNLKHYRKLEGLSQKQLSDLLDLGQSTIANYENGVREPSMAIIKRLGQVLRVPVVDLIGLHQGLKPSYPNVLDDNFYKSKVEKLVGIFIEKNVEDVMHFISGLSTYEMGLSQIADRIIAPALYKIGELWESSSLEVFEEHYISQAIQLGISYLSYQTHPQVKKNRPVFIGVLPVGEKHILGLQMMSSYLLSEGWQVKLLGGNLSHREIVNSILKWHPDVIGISVTMSEFIDDAMLLINTMRSVCNQQMPKIVVSGQALNYSKADELKGNCDYFGTSISELEKYMTIHRKKMEN